MHEAVETRFTARLHDGGWPSGRRSLLLQARLHLVRAINEYTQNSVIQEFLAYGVRVVACTTWLAIVDDTTSVYDCAGYVSGILANVDLVVSGSVLNLGVCVCVALFC